MPDAKLTKCKPRKKKRFEEEEKNSHKDLGNATQGVF